MLPNLDNNSQILLLLTILSKPLHGNESNVYLTKQVKNKNLYLQAFEQFKKF